MSRAWWAVGVALLLVSEASAATSPQVRVVLTGDGLTIAGPGKAVTRIKFGTPKAKVVAAIAKARGLPRKQATNPDCGSGTPMDYAAYKGGLELDFVKGEGFVGWILQEGGDTTLRTAKGVGLGTPRRAVKLAYPKMAVEETGLGTQFFSSGDIDAGDPADGFTGVFTSAAPAAKVAALWAGQTCIAT